MIYPWKLQYWQSGEWQVVNERLKDMERRHEVFNPSRECLFAALRGTSVRETKVVILGQDPYPDGRYCTGYAFSIPETLGPEEFPPTLRCILKEYSSDLGLPTPSHGSLLRWAAQGVLLWNAIPTCRAGRSLSHDWEEYHFLTKEIVQTLAEKGIVFAFLGSVAREYAQYVSSNNEIIVTGHPSPRGNLTSRSPFTGSRIFSTINDRLNKLGLDTVDWRLDVQNQRDESNPDIHGKPPRVWDSNRRLSWQPGTHTRGVHHPGRLEVHE